MFKVELDSKGAERAIAEMEAACRAVGALGLDAGGSAPYTSPAETGVYRTGRRAGQQWSRRGGAHMIERGIAAAGPQLESMVADGIPNGPGGVNAAMYRQRRTARASIQALTPVRTDALRSSITVIPR